MNNHKNIYVNRTSVQGGSHEGTPATTPTSGPLPEGVRQSRTAPCDIFEKSVISEEIDFDKADPESWSCGRCGSHEFFLSQGYEGGVAVKWSMRVTCPICGGSTQWGA